MLTGRPRAVWLIDSADPSGAAVLTVRRARALRPRLNSSLLALSAPATPVPGSGTLAGIPRAAGLAGEARIARADVVVTTSERTLASAAARLRRGARLVHLLHTRPECALRSELFLRRITTAAAVGVPLSVDPVRFARHAGLDAEQVRQIDDGVAPEQVLLGDRARPVVTAVGRLPRDSAVLDLVAGFQRVRSRLPGWQLRVAGWGPGLEQVRDLVADARSSPQVLVLGARHDSAELIRTSGYVARLDDGDVSGLSVLDALGAGVPVLSTTTVPAAGRLVRDGSNGRLLDRTDPDAIGAALVDLADPDTQARLRAGASATVVPQVDPTALAPLFGLPDTTGRDAR